ncbi:hypothetical protein AYO41_04090 [Verrucomicrobia bacterium SCGC AG-212-E04]|nr:hypothetical protein AYO41_04090 [Verrucomicrobia bacterium SCGC AG-212-E04]
MTDIATPENPMAEHLLDHSRVDERSRLIRLGIILVDIYALVALAVIILQSAGARLPAEMPAASLSLVQQSSGYDVGVAVAVRHRHDINVMATKQGMTFMARQACPGRLTAAARDTWISEFMAGYQSAVEELRPTVSSVAGLQVAVESSNR